MPFNEIKRIRGRAKTPPHAVRLNTTTIRIGSEIIEQELKHLPSTVTDKMLYMKIVQDEEGEFWFTLLPHKDPNSMRVIRYDHAQGYTYYSCRYSESERYVDGIELEKGIYHARAVKSEEGRRYRKMTWQAKG